MKIYSPSITGSTGILGSLTVTGGVTSSLQGTASFAISSSNAANAGLVKGTATNSLVSAPFLTTTPATASGVGAITLGNNAKGYADYSIVIGDGAQNYDASRNNAVYIGRNANGAQNSIAIGWGASTLSDSTVAIGRDARSNADYSVAIGYNAYAWDGAIAAKRAISIGYNTQTQYNDEINIGNKFYFNSGSSGIIKLDDDVAISGSLTVTGSLSITAGFSNITITDLTVSGSVNGNVNALSISSNTASLDCSTANFFTLTLVSGSNTYINPTNVSAGLTLNLQLIQPSVGFGTISWNTSIAKFENAAPFQATQNADVKDVVTLISFDGSTLQATGIKNFS
jgi:hypothetical protein